MAFIWNKWKRARTFGLHVRCSGAADLKMIGEDYDLFGNRCDLRRNWRLNRLVLY